MKIRSLLLGSAAAAGLATGAYAADPVTTGSNVAYGISIDNLNATFEGTDIQLNEAVPAGTTMVSLSAPAGWSCTAPPPGSTGNVTCSRLSLPAGGRAAFTLTVKLGCSLADGATVTDTASITSTSRSSKADRLTTRS